MGTAPIAIHILALAEGPVVYHVPMVVPAVHLSQWQLGHHLRFTRAQEAIHMELAHGIKITVVIGLDIAGLSSTDDLVDLLVDRYTELRVSETCETI